MSTTTTPNAGPPRRKGPAPSEPGFTEEMRDRQARGKDPYDEEDEDEDEDEGGAGGRRRRLRLGHGPDADSFEDRERRGYAMSVLDSPEQLMMYAQSTGDSIPGQRLRFMSMLCGFNPPAATTQPLPESKKTRRDAPGTDTDDKAGR